MVHNKLGTDQNVVFDLKYEQFDDILYNLFEENMTEHTYKSFTDAFVGLAKLVNNPEYVCQPRGMKIKEHLGVKFVITNPRDRLLFIPERKFSLSYMMGEILWYISGNNSTEWISNYSQFWSNISDDGVTANSAYGSRIFKPHDRICGAEHDWTQWQYVIDELKRDPDSRRAVIHIRSPKDSMLAVKDVPCTLTLQFFIRDGKLHQIVSMRSSDLIFGISYDVPAFTFFQEMLANELGVELGSYVHISNSLHVYERHFEMLDKIAKNSGYSSIPMNAMPNITNNVIQQLIQEEQIIQRYKTEADIVSFNSWLKSEKHEYWHDMIQILLMHKAQKLSVNENIIQELKNGLFDRSLKSL